MFKVKGNYHQHMKSVAKYFAGYISTYLDERSREWKTAKLIKFSMSGYRGQAHCIWSSGIAADDLPTGSFFGGPSSHARFSQNRRCHSSCTGRKHCCLLYGIFCCVPNTFVSRKIWKKTKSMKMLLNWRFLNTFNCLEFRVFFFFYSSDK